MSEHMQTLSQKIRQLELQGAGLLDGGTDLTYGDVTAPNTEEVRRSSHRVKSAEHTFPEGYTGLHAPLVSTSCNESIRQSASRMYRVDVPLSGSNAATVIDVMQNDGITNSGIMAERLPYAASVKAPYSAISFLRAQSPPSAAKTRLSLPSPISAHRNHDGAEQVDMLRAQVDEANCRCEQMRMQFRATIEDLNRRLHEAIAEKERLQDSRQKSELAQDELIARLQASLRELREAYQAQERALLEADSRAERLQALQAEQEQTTAALGQLVLAAEQRQQRRGARLSGPAAGCPMPLTGALHLLQQWLEDADNDAETKEARIIELVNQARDLQNQLDEAQQSYERTVEEKVSKIKETSSSLLQASEERSDNLKEQLNVFRVRATFLQEQLDQHSKMHADCIRELESKIAAQTAELTDERRLNNDKGTELKLLADEMQHAAAIAAGQLDSARQQIFMQEKRIETYEVMLERLRAECELERSQSQRLWRREEELSCKRDEVEAKLAERDAEVVRLRELVSSVKDECMRQLSSEIQLVEDREQKRGLEELAVLQRQLDASTRSNEQSAAQVHSAFVEQQTTLHSLRATQAQLQAVQQELAETQGELLKAVQAQNDAAAECARLSAELQAALARDESMAVDLRRALAEREVLDQRLAEEEQQRSALSTERDRCAAALCDCEAEARELRTCVEQLQERLEEASTRSLEERALALAEATAARERDLARADDERARIQAAYEQMVTTVHKLQSAEKQLRTKLKSCKAKLIEQDTGLKQAEAALLKKSEAITQLEKEVESKDSDVQVCRESIVSLTEERTVLMTALKGQEGQMQSEIGRLLQKLKALEHDYRLTQKTLQVKEAVDSKVTEAADRLQKELTQKRKAIDDCQGRIRWLEECLEVSAKEKRDMAADSDRLEEIVAQLKEKCHTAAAAASAEQAQQRDLRDKVRILEGEVGRLAARCQQLQVALHRSEQQTATMRLKQQLDSATKKCIMPAAISGSSTTAKGDSILPCIPQQRAAAGHGSPGTCTPGQLVEPVFTSGKDHRGDGDVKAMMTEVKVLLSAAQKEAAQSAGAAVRDVLGLVLPAVVTASRTFQESLPPSCNREDACHDSSTLMTHRALSQQQIRRSAASRHEGLWESGHSSTLSEEELNQCDVTRHRKTRSKVVSRSLQIEATLRCQNLEDRLVGLSKMGSHLKAEHNAMMELLKTQEQHMERIYDSQRFKELPC